MKVTRYTSNTFPQRFLFTPAAIRFINKAMNVLVNRNKIRTILEEHLGLSRESLVFDHCHFSCSNQKALQEISDLLVNAGFINVDLPPQIADRVAVFGIPDSNISFAIDKPQPNKPSQESQKLVLNHIGFIPKEPADFQELAERIKPADILEITEQPLPKRLIQLASLTQYFSGRVEILEESPLVKLTQHQT